MNIEQGTSLKRKVSRKVAKTQVKNKNAKGFSPLVKSGYT